jgi:fibronectin-binding autotransporter adhesin
VGIQLLLVGAAHAATATWTGTGGDSKFSTATNWSGNTAPVNGDDLVFDNTGLATAPSLTNDIVGLSVGTITFSGASGNDFSLSGNSITTTSGITNSATNGFGPSIAFDVTLSGANTFNTGSSAIQVTGKLLGTGTLTVSGSNTLNLAGDDSGLSGLISTSGSATVSADNVLAFAGGGISISSGTSLQLTQINVTYPGNVTIGGTGNGSYPAIMLQSMGGGGLNAVVTLSGSVTLTANTQIGGNGNRVLKITGPLSGSFTLTVATGQSVSLDIQSSNNTSLTPNGAAHSGLNVVTIPAGDNQPGVGLSVPANNEYVIDGVRGAITVDSGGILKGTGTVGVLTVSTGGIVAPGHSPGCLASGNLTLNGTYQAELGGTTACTGYDQLNVTGTVDVTGGTLTTTLYGGFKPAAGNTFTIINNDGSDAVTGTFSGLAEGATFNVSGYVFKISYKGGDGNDVVLTTVSVPKTPSTGYRNLGLNPLTALLALLTAAAPLAYFGYRSIRSDLI